MKKLFVAAVLSIAVLSCSQHDADVGSAGTIDELARDYLLLELSMGLHDPNHVDAYFGPPEIKNAAAAADLGLDEILAASATLDESLARVDTSADTELQQRIRGMRARLQALQTRIALNEGVKLDFDAESLRLFGTEAPRFDASHFDAILAKIDAMLPGSGSLAVRVEALTNAFEIPPDRLAAVFDAAIAECRRRTLLHIELPPGESFTIEYVTDKPWSGYNWYQGDAVSVIQINTDLPTNISRAVDLGCHEGYPGHHTYNALLEKNLVDDKQWLEFSLYPLFSPQSLIAEGSGNYGIDLAFPGRRTHSVREKRAVPARRPRRCAGRPLLRAARAAGTAELCRQRGCPRLPQRRSQSRAGGCLAGELLACDRATGATTGALL